MNYTKYILMLSLMAHGWCMHAAVPAQTIGLNFTAAIASNVLNFVSIPPDPTGWVGPEQYILLSYGIIRSFNKTTGQPDGGIDIDAASFFGTSAALPRINYSRFLNKWLMTCGNTDLALGYGDELLIAWSDSGIITADTVWTIHTFTNEQIAPQNIPADGPAILNDPQLASDANAVYISIDVGDTTTGAYLGTSTVVMPNSSFITGNEFQFTVFPGILPGPNATIFGFFIPPANNFDLNPTFGYIINAPNLYYPTGNTYNQLFMYRISNPGSNNPTLGPSVAIDVPDYSDPANAPHKGNLYTVLVNGVNAGFLETGYAIMQTPHVRNKQLFACHNIQVDNTGTGTPSGDRVGVRWYQFDLTGDPTGQGKGTETAATVPALVQYGTLYDPSATNPLFYYLPQIMTNKNGDLVINGTVSGANAYTNVFYAGRKATDLPGTLRNPVLITNNTSNPYNFGPLNSPIPAFENIGQAWGDFFSLAPDPSNDLDIWSTGEWAALVNNWGVQATQLIPAS